MSVPVWVDLPGGRLSEAVHGLLQGKARASFGKESPFTIEERIRVAVVGAVFCVAQEAIHISIPLNLPYIAYCLWISPSSETPGRCHV